MKFPEDDGSRIADLEWSDVDETSGKWKNVGGAWTGLPGTDMIRMNDAYLARGKRLGTDAWRSRVAAHELGHALGFCHKSIDWYFTLMDPKIRNTLALAAAVVIGTTAYGVLTAYDLRSEGTTEAITLFDPYDDLEVAGTSDDVFHGTVLERTADEISDRVPTEFYRVEVGETFKGKLSGTVTVAQTIGSSPSLTPGAKYLFTTSTDRDGRTHFVLAEVTLPKTPDLDAAPPPTVPPPPSPHTPCATTGAGWSPTRST